MPALACSQSTHCQSTHQSSAWCAACDGPVVLDSFHSYDNVRRELELYHEFVTSGMHLVVQDTKLDRLRGRRAAKAAAADFMRSSAARKFRVDKSREYLLYYTAQRRVSAACILRL